MTNASPQSQTLYVHIATLSSCSFLAGGALIVLQFQQGMQQGLEHERQSFQQYREQLALAIKLNQRPARMSLRPSARSGQLSAMTDLETRLAFLPQLAEVLANSTSYGAIWHAGYEDGDFFLVRKLTERARGRWRRLRPRAACWSRACIRDRESSSISTSGCGCWSGAPCRTTVSIREIGAGTRRRAGARAS